MYFFFTIFSLKKVFLSKVICANVSYDHWRSVSGCFIVVFKQVGGFLI